MNKRMGLIVLVFCCAIFCSCSSQAMYSDYSGIWSEDGVSYEDIMNNGGAEFHVEISDHNELTGDIYVLQGLTGRMAEIENITGGETAELCVFNFRKMKLSLRFRILY